MGKLFHLHPNIISYSRKQLVRNGFLTKEGKKYSITEKHVQIEFNDDRSIIIPHQVYNHKKLTTGAKLLWGEYNSMSKGYEKYFAKRLYTAKRLNASEESITNWTKQLFVNNFLIEYSHKKGYCKSQKVVITTSFS